MLFAYYFRLIYELLQATTAVTTCALQELPRWCYKNCDGIYGPVIQGHQLMCDPYIEGNNISPGHPIGRENQVQP